MNDGVVKVGLECEGGPAGIDSPEIGSADGVDAAGAFGLGGGDENPASRDESRLDDRESFPFVLPNCRARCRIQAGGALRGEDEELFDTADSRQVRGTVAPAY